MGATAGNAGIEELRRRVQVHGLRRTDRRVTGTHTDAPDGRARWTSREDGERSRPRGHDRTARRIDGSTEDGQGDGFGPNPEELPSRRERQPSRSRLAEDPEKPKRRR